MEDLREELDLARCLLAFKGEYLSYDDMAELCDYILDLTKECYGLE